MLVVVKRWEWQGEKHDDDANALTSSSFLFSTPPIGPNRAIHCDHDEQISEKKGLIGPIERMKEQNSGMSASVSVLSPLVLRITSLKIVASDARVFVLNYQS